MLTSERKSDFSLFSQTKQQYAKCMLLRSVLFSKDDPALTFETIAIEILPLSRSFWVVTWLVCDNVFTGPKMAKNDQKWPQND